MEADAESPVKRRRFVDTLLGLVGCQRRSETMVGDTAAKEDPLFAAVRELACQRPPAVIPRNIAPVVEVSGSKEFPWLNQRYDLAETSAVEEVLRRDWAGFRAMRLLGNGEAGRWLFLGRVASSTGRGSLPYLWHDQRNQQWKLATLGSGGGSHYLSGLPTGSAFPSELGEWKERTWNSQQQGVTNLKVIVVRGGTSQLRGDTEALVADLVVSGVPTFPELLDDVSLSHEDALEFYTNGFLIKRATEVGTWRVAGRALRAANLVVRDLNCKGDLRDYKVRDSHRGWSDFVGWVRELPALWTLIARMMAGEAAVPKWCQLAVAMPEGSFGEAFEGRADERLGTEYHIDGHGCIPNGFALLVGCSLTDPPEDSCSWGGFTVFPGSHLDTAFHRAYVKRAKRGGPRHDVGAPVQLRLRRGDVVFAHPLLAHRRAENWSEVARYMVYLRLRPANFTEGWEVGVLEDPFAVLRGVKALARAQ
mmetsp:Transcript_95264/g.269255  ORF Transcript_95264/g.269255 Transcript_95264/m.269255 type:complete len:477 (+) Transcript_95264:44-1474(+)